MGCDMEPETIISRMLKSIEKWRAVKRFIKQVLSTEEEEERIARRAIYINV